MDTKNALKFSDLKQKAGKAGEFAASFWMHYQQIIFITFFLIIALIGVFIWYRSLYLSAWSEEKKMQYTTSQTRDVNLREGEFQRVLNDIEKRKEVFNSEYNSVNNIFKP